MYFQTKSEDQTQAEKEWLEAERVWLIHKGGFTSAQQQANQGSEGNVTIRLDSGEVLSVEEEDIEKVRVISVFLRID